MSDYIVCDDPFADFVGHLSNVSKSDSIVDTVANMMEVGHDPFADFEGIDNVSTLYESPAISAEHADINNIQIQTQIQTEFVFQPDISVLQPFQSVQSEVKKARKSNKCSYDVNNLITFGTFDKKKIPRASNRRLLQVIHGLIDSEMRQIFDSDTNMLNSFYSDLNSLMKRESNKRGVVLVDNMVIRIPQKSLKSVLMSGKYNQIVQYIKQSSETEFTALEVNSLLCHYSKDVKFRKDFPRFKQEKLGTMVVLCLNK